MLESEISKKARQKIKDLLELRQYSTADSMLDKTVITYPCRVGHHIVTTLDFKTDLEVSKTFLIEFHSNTGDPDEDQYRDDLIWLQYHIKTVRLSPVKILHADVNAILREIHRQLVDIEKFPTDEKIIKYMFCNHCYRRILWKHPETNKPIIHPQTGNPRALNKKDGSIHECMEQGQPEYFTAGRKTFDAADIG